MHNCEAQFIYIIVSYFDYIFRRIYVGTVKIFLLIFYDIAFNLFAYLYAKFNSTMHQIIGRDIFVFTRACLTLKDIDLRHVQN